MKKIIFAVACLALAACTKTEIKTPAFTKGQIVTISASSCLNDGSKVTGTDDGTNINFKWETGDKILVKVGEASAQFTLKEGAGTASATFEGTMPAEGSSFDLQYPVDTPDLSTQNYVDSLSLPKDKMLFTATGCTLGSNTELKAQYAVLQLKLNGENYTEANYFKEITVSFSVNESGSYTAKYVDTLKIPDNTVIVPYALGADSAYFNLVVNPGTYKIEVNTKLWNDLIHPKTISTSSDKTLVAGECLSMKCQSISTCLAAGTRITMADGSYKKVEDIVEGDIVRTYDHEKGCISSQKICLTYKGDIKDTPLNLTFVSGKTLSIVGTHDLLLKDDLKYVRIDISNVKSYVGKQFYNAETGNWDELVKYGMCSEPVDFYCIYSAYHLNCIAEGLLTCPDDVDFSLNVYELDANLKADPAQLAADIQKYGLFNPAEKYPQYAKFATLWEELLSKYTNIAIGKGLVTKAQLLEFLSFWDTK